MNKHPDMRSYISDRVFNGIRKLTKEQTARHRERLKKALDKRNKK